MRTVCKTHRKALIVINTANAHLPHTPQALPTFQPAFRIVAARRDAIHLC
jgi:hypothetical protein